MGGKERRKWEERLRGASLTHFGSKEGRQTAVCTGRRRFGEERRQGE